MVCKRCSRVLLEEEMIEKYRKKMMALENKYMERQSFFKKVFKEVSKNRLCPHCKTTNPTIQKIPKAAGRV